MMVPRTRAWMFSSAVSRGRPANIGASAASLAATASAIAMVAKRRPSLWASSRASSREWTEEIAEGSEIPVTFSGPSAAAASAATTAESMPPLSATNAWVKPDLCA